MTKHKLTPIKSGKNTYDAGDRATTFKLPIDASHVVSTAQAGHDLLIRLDDGRVITIKNFFKHGQKFHQLAFSASNDLNFEHALAQDAKAEPSSPHGAHEDRNDKAGWVLGLGAVAVGAAAMTILASDSSTSGSIPDTSKSLTMSATSNADGTLTLTGSGEAGATVKVVYPDGTKDSFVIPASGKFSITSDTVQPSGAVNAVQVLRSGEVSDSAKLVFVDDKAPLAPTAKTTANPDGTLTVAGTAEPGSTVVVTFPDGTIGKATVGDNGQYTITSPDPQTSGSVTITATDSGGNSSHATAIGFDDGTPPLAPTVTLKSNPDGTVTLTGTAEPGSTINITFPDGTAAQAVIPANGQYALTSTTPQKSGTVTTTTTDQAGNTSPSVTTLVADTTPPLAPALTVAANPDGTLTVSGTAEPGSTVAVTFPDGTTATVPVAANGTYSATSATPQGSGPVTATASDAAGNASAPATVPYGDTTAPAAPALTVAANPDGTLTVSGTAEPGASVAVTFPDGTTATVPVAANGTYSATSTTPQGSGPVTVTASDAAGNASAPATVPYGDTTAPAAPALTVAANPDGTLTVSGTAEPGASVAVTFPDGTTATVPVAANGTYSATSTTPQGSGPVTATASDAAGNTSPATNGSYTDTIAPPAPTVNVSPNADGTINVAGTGEPGSTVHLTYPDGSTGTATVAANGTYSATSATPQGSGPVTATASDAAGNTSPATNGSYTDTIAPPAPTVNVTPNANGTINVAGTGEPGSTVHLTYPDGSTGTATVAANGTYSATSTTPQPSGNVAAQANDPAGNTSATTTAPYIAPAPSAPSIGAVTDNQGAITGNVPSGGSTDDTTPTLSGTGTPGNTIKVYDGATLVGTAIVDALGNWSATTSALGSGPHTLNVTATSPAGVVSAAASTTLTVDSLAVPGTLSFTNLTDTGSSPTDFVTQDKSFDLTIAGHETGATVVHQVSTNGGATWTTTTATQNNLADGSYQFRALVTDAVGNSSTTPVIAVTVDNTAPTGSAAVNSYTDNVGASTGNFPTGTLTDDTTPVLNGTLSAALASGETVRIYDNGIYAGNATVTGTSWTFASPALVAGTQHIFTAKVMDLAGNEGVSGTPFTLTETVVTGTTVSKAGLGYDLGSAGDFNGDGIEDFIVSATHGIYGDNEFLKSKIYVVYGTLNGLPSLADIDNLTTAQGIVINNAGATGGVDAGIMGMFAQTVGDINGDGYSDILLGSNLQDTHYVIFGQSAASNISLSSMNSNATADGFRIRNYDTGGWYAAGSGGGGDFNGDGYADILLGSEDTLGSGSLWVLYGHAGAAGSASWANLAAHYDGLSTDTLLQPSLGAGTHTVIVTGATGEGDSGLGASVQNIGDVNNDGYDDYIALAPRADNGSLFDSGKAYLVYGSAAGLGADFNTASWDSSKGVILTGSENFESLGGDVLDWGDRAHGDAWYGTSNTVASIGDINGDGIGDFAIGSPTWGDAQADGLAPGRVYVVYGKETGWTDAALGSLSGATGFILSSTGIGSNALLGSGIRSTGDVNGDGVSDFLIGAPNADTNGLTDNGAIYLVYGKAGGGFASGDLEALVTAGGAVKFTGEATDDFMGTNVGMGDWNGDGIQDIALPSWESDVGAVNGGAVQIIYGSTTGLTQTFTSGADALLGTASVVDRISGGQGNDTITGIGTDATGTTATNVYHDVAYGGAGNDVIELTGLNFTKVDGGLGIDTLKISAGNPLSIDPGQLGTRLQGIETIDLSNSGSTLTLDTNIVTQLKSVQNTDFTVRGGANDTVVLDNGVDAQWYYTGATKVIGGITFNIYHSTGLVAENTFADVLVQQGVQVHLAPAAQATQGAAATKDYAYSGLEVANVGDFNGDGIADFVVSAPANEAGREQVYGSKQYIVYGDVNGMPKFNLDAMTADQGIVLSTSNIRFGSIDLGATGNSLTGLGDMNGDGFDDFAMASNRGDSAFVIFGRGGNATQAIDLATITASNNGTATADGFIISNTGSGAWFGTGLAGGDINGDGYGDLVVGSSDSNGSGQYSVLFGHSGASGTTSWQNLYASFDGLHSVGNFAAFGALLPTSQSQNVTTTEFAFANNTADGDFGDRIAVVGDINSDGYNDYLVTVPRADLGATADAGLAYLVFGSANGLGTFDIKNLTAAQGIKLKGTEFGESLGGTSLGGAPSLGGLVGDANVHYAQSHSVSTIGDINNDGIDDFAVGSPGWGNQGFLDSGAGRTYVVYGQAAGVNWADMTLSSLNGTTGFILNKSSAGASSTSNTNNNQLGWSIAGAGDFNGDGLDDMVVSAVGETVSGKIGAGAAYVVFGQSGSNVASTFTATTDLDALVNNGKAAKFAGDYAQDHFGASVSMGDFNGDGVSDILVGAPGSDAGGPDAGKTWLIMGSQANLTQALSVNDDTLSAGTHSPGHATIVGGVDRIAGGLGNDTITGIGSVTDAGNAGTYDVAYGGAGNDRIEVTGFNLTRVDGGLGNDTLALMGSGMSLDLSNVGDKVKGFENIDLGNQGNTLTMRLADVLQMPDSLGPNGNVTVSGGATDTVDLVGSSWGNTGTTSTINGNVYDLWSSSLLPSANHEDDVWVQQGVAVV